ncbi:MAG: DUF262 domain-containing protein [Fibrobacterales bacterium]|nr:DUF262 domain-containing protein [Fibrobacterales bacterium]
MERPIETKSIGELLNGDEYIIPAYQRGYRWTPRQVKDLLEDLLDYAYDKSKGFYCLQPIIVRKHDDMWELVDGQQRLTTIVILLKALLAFRKFDEGELAARYSSKTIKITFETRNEDGDFLAHISEKSEREENENINQFHMREAYKTIWDWISKDAVNLHPESKTPAGAADKFLEILTSKPVMAEDEKVDAKAEEEADEDKSVKVILYKLKPDVDPIPEFRRINSGKIPVTDTELVKALLLQKKSYEKANHEEYEMEHALRAIEWENMENSLTRPDFWGMLSNDPDAVGRVDLLLDLIYQSKHNGQSALEKGELFRFFAEWAKVDGPDAVWKEIKGGFRSLETWFETPLVYNYVGLLSHLGTSVYKVFLCYAKLAPDSKIQEFVAELVSNVKECLGNLLRNKIVNGQISLSYAAKEGASMKKLLLFVNVMRQSIRRLEALPKDFEGHVRDASYFKFPFDLFDSQKWNAEHVDSATANTMTNSEDQKEWIAEAKACIEGLADDSNVIEYERDGRYRDAIEYIQEKYGSGNEPDDAKDGVGNFVLLDEQTNKSYGNHVFAVKAKKIRDRISDGVFVPLCTQFVFVKDKSICDDGSPRTKWSEDDKSKYHDFILKEYTDFEARK